MKRSTKIQKWFKDWWTVAIYTAFIGAIGIMGMRSSDRHEREITALERIADALEKGR